MAAPLPPDEEQRLEALARYEVLDTLPEASFDELVRLAAEICDTPIALMSLVDANRQWFKSAVGLDIKETPRSVAFCAHAILEREMFTVADAARDDRFARNPLVVGSPHLRFYAGAPIQPATGSAIGTVCVLDRVPRVLSDFQRNALRVIGEQVTAQLELRRHIRELAHSQEQLRRQRDTVLRLREEADELRSFVIHDLKNALAGVIPNAEFLLESARLTGDEADAARDLHASAVRMKSMLAELLDSGSLDRGRLAVRLGRLSLKSLIADIARGAERRFERSGQKLAVRTVDAVILGDEALLRRVIDNLLDNAVKYGRRTAGTVAIELRTTGQPAAAVITVTDDGPGIPAADRDRVFVRRTRLVSDEREHARDGYGIGLAFCRAAVEAHGGRIWVEDGQPSGAKFVMTLPTIQETPH